MNSKTQARLTAGTASRLPTEAVRVPHTRIGMLLMDMPGARESKRRTRKLAAPTVVEIPRKIGLRGKNECWARGYRYSRNRGG